MARKDMITREIDRLYSVIDEIRAEYDRLSLKMADRLMDDGDVLTDEEQAQYRLLYHLLKVYNGGNEE